jgi:hypothetical protein
MKYTLAAGLACLSLSLGGAALAETPPAGAAATTAAAPAAAASVDATPIEALVSDPASKAVLDKHLPGVAEHPSYDMFKSMTLKDVAPMSGGVVTEETLAAIQADLAKIGK